MVDLKDFKKVASTKTHTIFEHPEGHTIRIAHDKLAPEHVASLKELPKYDQGGPVTAPQKPSQPTASPSPQPQPQSSDVAKQIAAGFKKATGFAEGGPVYPKADEKTMSGEPGATAVENPYYQQHGIFNAMPFHPDSGTDEMAQSAQKPEEPQNYDLSQLMQNKSSQPQGDIYGTESYLKAYGQGLGETKAGIQQQAQAEGQLGKAQAFQSEAAASHLENLNNDYAKHVSDLNQERQSLIQDIQNQHIDPNHFLGSKDTLSKASTAIGLILGGLGGGLSGQENPALKFLNEQINRDIEAQKLNLGKSQNLLSANIHQYGNLRDATDMTRVMQMDLLSSRLKASAANAQDPMAKARALQAAGQLDMQSAPIVSQMAARKALMSGQQGGNLDPALAIRFLVPENEQVKVSESLGKINELNALHKEALNSFNDIRGKFMNGALSPNDVSSAKNLLAGKLSHATAGRYNQQEAEKLISSVFPQISDISDKTVNNKMERLNSLFNAMKQEQMPQLQRFGIHVPGISVPATPRKAPYNK
jgi:hypothetical protein